MGIDNVENRLSAIDSAIQDIKATLAYHTKLLESIELNFPRGKAQRNVQVMAMMNGLRDTLGSTIKDTKVKEQTLNIFDAMMKVGK